MEIFKSCLSYIMNFFNKYKDLFGVPSSTPIPQQKLTVNNNLFIDKPFVPTYQQTLSINSKLRDLRKDYSELEQQIQSINTAMKGTKRASSRKGKQIQDTRQRDKVVNSGMSPLLPSQNNVKNTLFLKHKKYQNPYAENLSKLAQKRVQPEQRNQEKDPFAKKRMTWLKDEQVNLIKHTEIDYVFNHKMKQQSPRIKEHVDITLPRAENSMFGSAVDNGSGIRGYNAQRSERFQPINRNQNASQASPVISSHQPVNNNRREREVQKGDLDHAGALRRRDEAKKNIRSRRQKLGYLYRTSW